MTERFTGIWEGEFYNLFSKEEYIESSSAIVRIDLKESEKWWLATDILLRFG